MDVGLFPLNNLLASVATDVLGNQRSNVRPDVRQRRSADNDSPVSYGRMIAAVIGRFPF